MPHLLKVIPAVALPRHLGVYDYAWNGHEIPSPGMLVEILFRGRKTFGLVIENQASKVERKLITIERTLGQNPLLPTSLVNLLLEAARTHAVSPALILKRLWPHSPPNHLVQLSPFQASDLQENFVLSQSRAEAQGAIEEIIKQDQAVGHSTLIASPDLPQAQALAQHLSPFAPQLLVRDQSYQKFWAVWNKVVAGPNVVIATSLAPFLPIFKLGSIIIDREEDSRHKHPDENPRLDRRQLLKMRAQREGLNLLHIFEAPRLESQMPLDHLSLPSRTHVEITVHHAQIRQRENLTYLVEKLQTSDPKNILVIAPGVGWGKRVICRDCGFNLTCEICQQRVLPLDKNLEKIRCSRCELIANVPAACPHCHGQNWRYTGWGRAFLKAWQPDILVAGHGHLVPGALKTGIKQIILAYPEYMTLSSDWRADERLLGLILTAQVRARDLDAQLYIVTTQPEHKSIKFAIAGQIQKFCEQELELRQKYKLPPYAHIITFAYPLKKTKPEVLAKHKQELMNLLDQMQGTLSEISEKYGSGRRRREGLLVAKLERGADYTRLFSGLPPDWVIDVDPEIM